jgi:hypothetical protein
MMQQVHNQYQAKVANKKEKTTVTKSSKKRTAKTSKPKDSKTNQPPTMILQELSNIPRNMVGTIVCRCGCQHVNLSAIKSFAKAEAKYYIRPNKFLEGRSCMESNARSQRAVAMKASKDLMRQTMTKNK